jgi:hypothetical protein
MHGCCGCSVVSRSDGDALAMFGRWLRGGGANGLPGRPRALAALPYWRPWLHGGSTRQGGEWWHEGHGGRVASAPPPTPLVVQGWRPDLVVTVEDAHLGFDGWLHGRCKRRDGR